METELCISCETNPIRVQKWRLCVSCYAFSRREGWLNGLSPFKKASKSRDNMINKYGKSIVDDFEKMAHVHSVSLQNIADKYGFTRERARQIFEILFGFKYTVFVNKKSDQRKENLRISRINRKDPREKIKRYQQGLQLKGAETEVKVLEICAKLNYEIRPYLEGDEIDLVINGYLVEIKSSHKTCKTSNSTKTEQYHFNILLSQRKADFFILHAVPLNKFFIVPQNALGSSSIYIPEKKFMEWNTGRAFIHKESQWYQYEEAWHLLKPITKDVIFHEAEIIGGGCCCTERPLYPAPLNGG